MTPGDTSKTQVSVMINRGKGDGQTSHDVSDVVFTIIEILHSSALPTLPPPWVWSWGYSGFIQTNLAGELKYSTL